MCILGWVKYYQQFEIRHFTYCGEATLPKKLERKQKKNIFLHKWHANLHGFLNICKLSGAQNFQVMQSKIC